MGVESKTADCNRLFAGRLVTAVLLPNLISHSLTAAFGNTGRSVLLAFVIATDHNDYADNSIDYHNYVVHSLNIHVTHLLSSGLSPFSKGGSKIDTVAPPYIIV